MIKKIVAIIPARGGSKGLPRKNIIDLAGKPLIAWTIEAALKSKYITKTIVSSDDEEILNFSKNYGADVIERPDNLASDTATSESVVDHTIDFLQCNGEEFDILVLLQPTSPLRTSIDIDSAFEIMFDNNSTAIISVFETDNKILKSFKYGVNGYIEGISNNKYPFMRRQDLPKTYMPNGAIYIVNIDAFRISRGFMTDRTSCYVMPITRSLDIDTELDLRSIERIIKIH
jgi:CMP-N,N'-diacetyllegionaminic acid synthase